MAWKKRGILENVYPVLLITEIILWGSVFLMDTYANNYRGIVWITFAIFQTAIIAGCGAIIKKMHYQLQIDGLTGLYNKGFFYTKLSELKAKTPVSLLLIDVDNFKIINDRYGHIVGDRVLQQLAEILQNSVRKDDVLARWGGEEFAVILPCTDPNEAFKAADRIRKVIANHTFSYENITCRITASIGVVSAEEGARVEVEKLFKLADDALYRAKEKKNDVVVA